MPTLAGTARRQGAFSPGATGSPAASPKVTCVASAPTSGTASGGRDMSAINPPIASAPAVAALTRSHRKVILASSLGTVFEWYDFYLYGSLAPLHGAQVLSGGH